MEVVKFSVEIHTTPEKAEALKEAMTPKPERDKKMNIDVAVA